MMFGNFITAGQFFIRILFFPPARLHVGPLAA
jgi:hypothetical protein